jgi:hypothetical protein
VAADWTEALLQQIIHDQTEESQRLDYKAAAAIGKQNNVVDEITKDVSAMTNASGGVLIYGIREYRDKGRRHLPEAIDAVNGALFSREWLDQIIGTIQPRIEGVEIYPVRLSAGANQLAYVVDVPQANTAHQARDFRYYRRYNFESVPMNDYEIRDVMNRRTHPQLTPSVHISIGDWRADERSEVMIRLRNDGPVLARHAAAVVRLPLRLSGRVMLPVDPTTMETDGSRHWFEFRVRNGINAPIFPGDEVVLKRQVKPMAEIKPDPGESISHIGLTIFADAMPKIEVTKDVQVALTEWA